MELGNIHKNAAIMTFDINRGPNMKQIEESAKEFEAMFISEMMKPMFDGLEPDPMFGGGKGEEIFKGFMVEEYGKMLAQTGQLGIADMVKQQMTEMQEKASGRKVAQNLQDPLTTQANALDAIVNDLTGE